MLQKKQLSLKQNFLWTLGGHVVYGLLQWFIIILLTKFATVEVVGYYTLGLAITAPIMLFFNMQLRNVQATDIKEEHTYKEYYIVRLTSMIVGLLIVCIWVVLGNYNLNVQLLIVFIALTKVIEGFSDLTYGVFQKNENMKLISYSLVYRGGLALVSFALILIFIEDVKIAILSMVISWCIVYLFFDKPNAKRILKSNYYSNAKIKNVSNLFILALPLGIVSLITSLTSNLPRLFIEKQIDVEVLGVFGAISFIGIGLGKFSTSLSLTVSPRLAKYYAGNQLIAFKTLLIKFLFISFIFGFLGLLAALFFGEVILEIFYTPVYAKYNDLFILIMISSIFTFILSALNVAITSMRIFNVQVPINILKLIVTAISLYLLVGKYGVYGAAYSLIISSIVTIPIYAILINKNLRKNVEGD